MENEDGPNFSYAYSGASTALPAAQSWNPALRPDNVTDSSDAPSLKELQPSPQIVPQSKPELDSSADDEDELPELPALPATSVAAPPVSNDTPPHEPIAAAAHDDLLNRNDPTDAPASPPRPPRSEQIAGGVSGVEPEPETSEEEEEEEEEVEEEEESSEESSEEEELPTVPAKSAETVQPSVEAAQPQPVAQDSEDSEESEESEESSDAEASEEHPEEHYEHQGEATVLEEAVADSAKAPLVASATPAEDDWGSSDDVFDLGGKPQDAPAETPLSAPLQPSQAGAAGTTVGDEVIGDTTVGGNTGDDIDWGNTDDQDFFGGASTAQAVEPQQSTDQSPGAHIVEDSSSKPVADPVWDLELDDDLLDDDLLPESEAPVFELDDDEGFLEDEPSEPAPGPVQSTHSGSTTASRYAPQAAQAPQPIASPYGVPTPPLTNFSQIDPKKPAVAPPVVYGAYGQPARPPMTSSAQSFVDKSKGGYHSPYDLPEDIVTQRKRPAPRPSTGPVVQGPPPPPRSSSMSNAPPRPLPPSNVSATSMSPPSSGHSMQSHMTGLPLNAPPKPAPPSRPASTDFFAELPVTSKPKLSPRYTPQQNVPQQPQTLHAPPPPLNARASSSSLRNQILPDSDIVPQLQQPDRLPVFPDQPSAPVRSNSLPVPQPAAPPPSTRYSPAPPPSAPSVPSASSRYSPAPPPAQTHAQPPTAPHRPPVQPYAPRTSSPLAHHTLTREQNAAAQHTSYPLGQHNLQSPESIARAQFKSPLEGVNEVDEQGQPQPSTMPRTSGSATPPPQSSPSSAVGSPRKTSYTPQHQSIPTPASTAMPPPRASSQSPTATMKQRPASGGYMSPTSTIGALPTIQGLNRIPHRRQVSHDYECIPPTDERIHDPLERWKGAPIFTWGLGGTVITSFPQKIPRYGGGASAPMLKCSPGEIKVTSIKETLPLPEDVAKFPGPLKKSKKKDVSAWLGRRIEALENQLKDPGLEHTMPADDIKRLEEKTFLWKVLQLLVDHDGHLEGNPTVEAAVRKVLSPESENSASDPEDSFSTPADLVGITRSDTAAVQAEAIDPRAVEELRNFLTKGDREKAVWHAVDQRLWGHAMLLSSTLNKDIWKQVVQEFVRKEVKKVGRGNQALAVLYEVFAGNHEDCIDELVPASARAGFQMVSTDGAGSAHNALQGLDKWRETLALVLNNRSENDASALLSLGKLLASYGRVEAAHICAIFARSVAHVGGVDDTQADIVLIGADHRRNPLEVGVDVEPILLTEVYEFALSLSAQGGSYIIPHLQNYKLAHAYQLAEYGHRADAQAYCDAITTSMKSTTRISPYYNASFIASLEDLSKRLSQSPKDGSSSWISKPSMDKVSSSLLSKFNSFIAGDDDEGVSNGSPGGEVGPFAKIAGNTPNNLSPSQSSADLYGAYSGYGGSAAAPAAPAPSNSRYAPSNAYAPRTSLDQNRSRYEPQGRPSLESADGAMGGRAASDTYLLSPQASGPYTPAQAQFSPPSQTKSQTYSPLRADAPTPLYGNAYQPTAPAEESMPAFGGYLQPQASFDEPAPPAASSGGHEPPSTGYEPPASSYEPPSTGYEPPSYQPYNPDDEPDSPVETKPKKKSFMDDDDDDDIATRAATLKDSKKSEADRKADEAFRKAAEADAQRDKEAAAKKSGGGWFGGWFKKDPNAGPGPIKAKLGEENSFYYDPDLKKWVNKKAGAAEASKPMATPPPPKGGPPARSTSGGSMGPPSSLPSPGMLGAPPTSNPQRSSSMPPPMGIPGSRASTPGIPSDNEGRPPVLARPPGLAGSGPPSRPSTGMSNASSIDDLIGAPQARKGAASKKKKGGRYVDVMAK